MSAGRLAVFVALAALACSVGTAAPDAPDDKNSPFPGTKPLTLKGDIASELVAGVDRFLLREIDKSVARRAAHWKRDCSSPEAYSKSIEPNRKRLAHILGVRDPRVPIDFDLPVTSVVIRIEGMTEVNALDGLTLTWPVLGDMQGEGLVFYPPADPKMPLETQKPRAVVIAIPDADQAPEQLAGLAPGTPAQEQYLRRLTASGCLVLVPRLINRKIEARAGRAKLTNREFLYRPAFELGRHLIGYELQKVLALVDWVLKTKDLKGVKIGVIGWGEGGLLALNAGALDSRIHAVCVSGYFDNRNNVWQEPIDRNVFGLLEQFGDAELASMIAPRALIVEAARGPQVTIPPGLGGAPGRLVTPKPEVVRREVERARKLVEGLKTDSWIQLVLSGDGNGPPASKATLEAFGKALFADFKLVEPKKKQPPRKPFDTSKRQRAQVHEIDRHNQELLKESPYVRREFLKKLADPSNLAGNKPVSLEQYRKTVEEYRRYFRDEVIGHFDDKLLPFNARSRKTYDRPKWTGYEVVLDVFPDVIAYGVLLLPKDLKPGEKRPVVVCQHGLEGRPRDVITGNNPAYHDFAAKLAERGFITFAPQNLYIFHDRFRTLQRKANPIKKTLFSVIVPQHQQIVNWLKTLPNVDPKRIGFYGLSYGGKSAMRIPPLVPDYCLSICSADFNDWVWKNASSRAPYSYVWTGEYEIFEFDLGSTFNYSEMAALIAPRPFMVERGHFDGVGPDERVAYEFAKVRFLYEARLGLKDHAAIEWFVGPHTINGKGTFDFLHKHLAWPRR